MPQSPAPAPLRPRSSTAVSTPMRLARWRPAVPGLNFHHSSFGFLSALGIRHWLLRQTFTSVRSILPPPPPEPSQTQSESSSPPPPAAALSPHTEYSSGHSPAESSR